MNHNLPAELPELARTVVDRMNASIHLCRGPGYAQLIASELYEALQVELSQTPTNDYSKRRVLSAAIDHCRRSAAQTLAAPRRIAELESARSLLEMAGELGSEEPHGVSPVLAGPTPRFRVIQGGLSLRA